ncbi:hypothetical protein [Bifidobacterium phasiani]|uniref:Tail fiber protein n=1 Tax=Bifidobacterium phasiani TaxID=2834431 RepID=A0ABS6WCL6_9BIFI|nr:hypothetical protein [Bifidobacterium phasiani]MBW3083804.1 hypothetical protein [Bifidobacterium phasiani]
MTAQTSRYKLTYPTGSDLVSAAPSQLQTMAESIESALGMVDDRQTDEAVKPVVRPTLAQLADVAGVAGQTGYVTADTTTANNGPYYYNGAAWVKYADQPTIDDLLQPVTLQFSHVDYDIQYSAYKAGRLVMCFVKATRTGGSWDMSAWTATQICAIPDELRPAVYDINFPGVDNTATAAPVTGFILGASSISLRAYRAVQHFKGAWTHGLLTWVTK